MSVQPRHRCPECGIYVAQRGKAWSFMAAGAVHLRVKLYGHVDPSADSRRPYEGWCTVTEIELAAA